jgi:hypothetical protein
MPAVVKAWVGSSQLRGTTSLIGDAVPGGWMMTRYQVLDVAIG